MTDSAVYASNVVVAYGDHEAVRGVDLRIRQGEFYTLLGTNGAGKTSLLEAIEGLRRPQAGTIEVLGGDPKEPLVRSRLGIMLQESGFAPDLTAAESIGLFGGLSGRRDAPSRVLELVGLENAGSTRVANLSGGERRRLDLAVALFGTPELLFLDEPSAGLDPQARDRLWSAVRGLAAQGTTVFLTTHYLEEAEAHADRVGVMHDGRLVVEGSLTELAARNPARIRFEVSRQVSADLPVTATWDEGTATIETRRLQEDLTTLLAWARERAIVLGGLSATAPGLRDLVRSVSEGGADV
ncbi:MAG: hypothetical protein B5766_12790 [Candidatus Lumbricidophila eiseniae]|uniref:ABC transporter domain-containing protein n=1 Tax=Candidatus Lumbricidiphila eiseniae TaxID=1969409 RepID=A0A2A6FNE3_9MICO|nr:MAG: hypothetical protein B5766_12790 [Candidatus Lumbricidophila eiseniae]